MIRIDNRLRLGLLILIVFAFNGCSSVYPKKVNTDLAFVPKLTNQLTRIAYYPLINEREGTIYGSLEFNRSLVKDCGDVLIPESEKAWIPSNGEFPSRHDMKDLGKALKADGTLAISLEDSGELSAVILNLPGNSVWRKTFKQRQNFRISAQEICRAIKKGDRFQPLPIDKGNKVLVLPLIYKDWDALVAKEWRSLIELRFKSKGYTILPETQLYTPKYIGTDDGTSKNNLFIPKGFEARKTDKVYKLNIDISSVAAKSGADWIVVSTLEKFTYTNVLVFEEIGIHGKVETYDRNGKLVNTSVINTGGVVIGFVAFEFLDKIGYAAERLSGKSLALGPVKNCLKAAYLKMDVPRYW